MRNTSVYVSSSRCKCVSHTQRLLKTAAGTIETDLLCNSLVQPRENERNDVGLSKWAPRNITENDVHRKFSHYFVVWSRATAYAISLIMLTKSRQYFI